MCLKEFSLTGLIRPSMTFEFTLNFNKNLCIHNFDIHIYSFDKIKI